MGSLCADTSFIAARIVRPIQSLKMSFSAINRLDHKAMSPVPMRAVSVSDTAPRVKSSSSKQQHKQQKSKHRVNSELRGAKREDESASQLLKKRKQNSPRKTILSSQVVQQGVHAGNIPARHQKTQSQHLRQLSSSKSLDLDNTSSTSASSDSIVSHTTTTTTKKSQLQPRQSTVSARMNHGLSAPSPSTTDVSTPCPLPKGAQKIAIPFDPNSDPATIESIRQRMIKRAIEKTEHRTYSAAVSIDKITAEPVMGSMENLKDRRKRKHESLTNSSASEGEKILKTHFELENAVGMQIRLEKLKLRRSGHVEYQHLFSDMSYEQMDQQIKELNINLAKMWKETEIDMGVASSEDEGRRTKQEGTDRPAKKHRTDAGSVSKNGRIKPLETSAPVSRAPSSGLGPDLHSLQVVAADRLFDLLPGHLVTRIDEVLSRSYPHIRSNIEGAQADKGHNDSTELARYESLDTTSLIKVLTRTTNLSKKEAKKLVRKHRATSNTDQSDTIRNSQTTAWKGLLATCAARELILRQSKNLLVLHGGLPTSTDILGVCALDGPDIVKARASLVHEITTAAASHAGTSAFTPSTAKNFSSGTVKKHGTRDGKVK